MQPLCGSSSCLLESQTTAATLCQEFNRACPLVGIFARKFKTEAECGHDVTRSRLFVVGGAVYLSGLSKSAVIEQTGLVADTSCQIVAG